MMRWWRSHSIRVRLTLWYVAAMIVVLAVYAAAVLAFVNRSVSTALDQRIRDDYFFAAATVDEAPDGMITWPSAGDLLLDEDELLPWVQVWSADGKLLFRNAEAERVMIPEGQMLATQADNQIVTVPGDGAPLRVLSRVSYIGPRRVVIQVARSEAQMRGELRQLVLILALGLPLAVAVAGIGGYTLARRALRPIERMTERAKVITAERLSDRLPVHNPDDEMGSLANVFNETLGRLELSFEQMRRFTADVSHEVRTPLTAIRSVGEVGLREHRDDAAYRGIIGSMLEEVDRLTSLVDRLLTLSRAETGESRLQVEEIDLRALGENAAAHLAVLAEEKGQTIVVEGVGTPHAYADRLVLRQALINLVDNAIKYSPAGGRIRIRVAETADEAMVEVIDSGEGIDPASRARIFDRFYRAGHVGEQRPGVGLGLSIAKGAVEANGGRLTLEVSGGTGSTFRIVLPRVARAPHRAVS